MSAVRFAAVCSLCLLPWGALACGGTESTANEPNPQQVRQPIRGGQDDQNDNSVVGIVMQMGYEIGICSGSLIAPNLVLTARHCVAEIASEYVQCGVTKFGSVFSASSFHVTTDWKAPATAVYTQNFSGAGWYRVSRVIVPTESADVCGFDVALLELSSTVPESVTAPIAPRVQSPVAKGEQYYAIGYGATDDSGSGSGRRRRLDNLFVDCVGDCPSGSFYRSHEWGGDKGICQGDSGGPALDMSGQVVGIVSRGGQSCSSPIYGSVYAWRDLIIQAALEASDNGGYPAPAWTSSTPTPTGQLGETCTAPDSCQSQQCYQDMDEAYCSVGCSADNPSCPELYECDEGAGLCRKAGGFGRPCVNETDCRSGQCLVSGSGSYCTKACDPAAPLCPDTYTCGSDNGLCMLEAVVPDPSAYVPPSSSKSGCGSNLSAQDPSHRWGWGFAALALGAALYRARRR